jgi:hypothetical protein
MFFSTERTARTAAAVAHQEFHLRSNLLATQLAICFMLPVLQYRKPPIVGYGPDPPFKNATT